MKRKVLRHGQSSLTISLPSQWLKKNHIKYGDELEIDEHQTSLIISQNHVDLKKSISIDLKDITLSTKKIIGAVYKTGYDEVLVKVYTDQHQREVNEEIDRTCNGYDIIDHKKDTILIKSILKEDIEEFKKLVRRMQYLVIENAREMMSAVQHSDILLYQTISERTKQIYKYSNYLRRVILKLGSPAFSMAPALYHYIETFHFISKRLRHFSMMVLKENISFKASKKILCLFERIIKLISQAVEFFHNCTLKQIDNFTGDLTTVHSEIYKSIISEKDNILVLFLMDRIIDLLDDVQSSILIINFLRKEESVIS
ncbi:hypothetical protein HYY69_02900 [Candidatus Woesearchaeota archaeon]|nr:hypothetical protein [Candidatus Woesearchaeota archaeon]